MIESLLVEFSDGSVYSIPAHIIADNRASYYRDKLVGIPERASEYLSEYEYAINNSDELIDWAKGNMNWEDICGIADVTNITKPKPNYSAEWCNAIMRTSEGDW